MRIILVFTAFCGVAAAAQPDPSGLRNYTLAFENDYVRVTRVRYAPHEKLPPHPHTDFASAYVYLNDSGPVVFRHVGGKAGTVTRPPTTKGAYRLFRAVGQEVHEVENLSERPSDFLRVEFKTDPVEPRTLRGTYRADPAAGESSQAVEFENAQVRLTRMRWTSGAPQTLEPSTFPSLVISLNEDTMGAASWLPPGAREALAPPASGEALRMELKTAPIGRSPDHEITRSPDRQITRSRDRRITHLLSPS